MRSAVKLGIVGLFLQTAFAQSPPNTADILKKVSETYKSASEYELAGDMTAQGDNAPTGARDHFLFAFKAPNQYRMEGTFPGGANLGDVVAVHDGSAIWMYAPKSNQYVSFPASQLTDDAPGDLGDLRPQAMDYFMMMRFREAVNFVNESKFLREESIDVAGKKVDCFVVAVSQGRRSVGGPNTWWVDKKGYRILREDHDDSSAVFTTIKLDEALPDDLFQFVPPAGAQKIEPPR
jgi:outer membrane lipoprotein-sorting protein